MKKELAEQREQLKQNNAIVKLNWKHKSERTKSRARTAENQISCIDEPLATVTVNIGKIGRLKALRTRGLKVTHLAEPRVWLDPQYVGTTILLFSELARPLLYPAQAKPHLENLITIYLLIIYISCLLEQ